MIRSYKMQLTDEFLNKMLTHKQATQTEIRVYINIKNMFENDVTSLNEVQYKFVNNLYDKFYRWLPKEEQTRANTDAQQDKIKNIGIAIVNNTGDTNNEKDR